MNWYDVNKHGQYVLNNVDGNFALREDVESILNNIQHFQTKIATFITELNDHFRCCADDVKIPYVVDQLTSININKHKNLNFLSDIKEDCYQFIQRKYACGPVSDTMDIAVDVFGFIVQKLSGNI